MQIDMTMASKNAPIKRIYIAAATLKEFRGRKNLEVQLVRTGAKPEEIEACKGLGLVGAAPADMPEEILAGATEEAALACLMEAFTEEEAKELCEYMEKRYGGQISQLTVGPFELPVPLGVGPLAQIPESDSSGFLNFDEAPDYPLKFKFKGFYDLNA